MDKSPGSRRGVRLPTANKKLPKRKLLPQLNDEALAPTPRRYTQADQPDRPPQGRDRSSGQTEHPSAPWYVSNVSIISDCSMLLYYHSWMFYNHFIDILYHFLVPTYWHSAKCQLLFSPCFLHRRKSISDGVQMPRNFTMIFYEPKGRSGDLVAPGGSPPLCSINTPIFQKSLGRRWNIHPAAAESRTTRSNLDTITQGFTTSICAYQIMHE